jgi:hypothetical protein
MSDGKEFEKVKGFKVHGVYFKGSRGDQFFGDCAFCGGQDKFHVGKGTMLWDCKKCGRSGNFSHFLEEVIARNLKDMDQEFLQKLCIDRKLPMAAFVGLEVGRDGLNYTYPVRDERGRIVDVRMYRTGSKRRPLSTATCHTGIFGLHFLRKMNEQAPIYLCEGEWDFMAMRWLLGYLKMPGIALGVPGAGTFKKEWSRYFQDRVVNVLYDNDNSGEDGEIRVSEALTSNAKELKYIHWSEKLPSGYDIRDLITQEAIKKKKPKKTYYSIRKMLKAETRKRNLNKEAIPGIDTLPEDQIPQKHTLEEVYKTFDRWLFLKSHDPIDVMLSVVVSNKIEGDPLWLFLVSPPGGAKTEILSSLSSTPEIYFTSSLTPHALISGASWTSGSDPSLIPKLNGKVLAIKDFTSIMSKRDTEKEEIFGILRDAYDGKCSKVFGNGIRRNYESRFTVLSAVTPAIYELAYTHQSLGERFLKYTMGANLVHVSEEDIVSRAITNLNRETTMRKDLCDVVQGFLYHLQKDLDLKNIPTIPDEIKSQIVSLAMFCARMRGTVHRDHYRPDMVSSKPSAEVGSRLGKQLAKFCISYAIVKGKKVVTEAEYAVCKKIALDTISQRNEDIICAIFREVGGPENANKSVKTRQLSFLTKYPHSTISRVLSDMQMLSIVDRVGKANAYEWRVSDYVMELIRKAKLYIKKEELERPKTVIIQPVRKKKKVIIIRRKL